MDPFALIRQLQGRTAGVRGRVAASGAVSRGTGFTVNRSATGTYAITFDTALKAVPEVSVVLYPNGVAMQATVTAESVSGVTIVTYNSSTLANTNCDFGFVVHPTV